MNVFVRPTTTRRAGRVLSHIKCSYIQTVIISLLLNTAAMRRRQDKFPHGLARADNSRNYIRTQPHVPKDMLKDMRIENGRPQKVFTVVGTSEPRVVRLFPNVTCSCPAKSDCYHVLAAKMSVGLHNETLTRKLNLTQLRKNKRKRPDKTAGRKRPRTDDMDVIPAGDAEEEELQSAINTVRGEMAGNNSSRPNPIPSSSQYHQVTTR